MGSPLPAIEPNEERTHRRDVLKLPKKPVAIDKRKAPADVWSSQLVLCLDGGGIKGYSSLIILQELMREIMALERSLEPIAQSSDESPLFEPASATEDDETASQNLNIEADPEDSYRLCHYFDYICGTSLGGITAIMLGTMRLTVRETVARSKSIWRGVVPGYTTKLLKVAQIPVKSRNTSKLQKRLQNALENFGEEDDALESRSHDLTSRSFLAFASNTMKAGDGQCQTVVFAMQSSTKGVMRPYAIRSYSHTSTSDPLIRNPEKDTTTISLVDACRATSAAPAYFRKARIDEYGAFSDGSEWLTNPAEEAYREVHDLHASTGTPIQALLSVGYSKLSRKDSQDDPPKTQSYALETTNADNADEMLRERQRQEGFEYERLVCPASVGSSGDMDKLFGKLEFQARAFCNQENIRDKLRRWARFLVSSRRKRAHTVRWEEYAGLQRGCPFCASPEIFADRSALAEHVMAEHKVEKPHPHTSASNLPNTSLNPDRSLLVGLGRRHSAR